MEKVHTLNRQLAHLTGTPLNLKDAGISDGLKKIEQVATTAMEDGAMLYNPVEPERDAVIAIIRKAYHTKAKPLPVSRNDLRPRARRRTDKQITQVFKDSEMLYDILIDFYSGKIVEAIQTVAEREGGL